MNKYIFTPLFFVVLLAVPTFSLAQSTGVQGGSGGGSTGVQGAPSNPSVTLINPLSAETDLETFLRGILDVVISVGTVVVILMLVYVGFLFATTSVNPENKVKARTALLWTLVGSLVLLGAKAIAEGIEATVNALS
ncbi:hypothetical protein A3H77_02345 [Candidatus Kaiserbacteria bacterium RIFCSPLOWO2_02_FULL_56_11]|uniref:Uncharacterized protein n=2 Tax=Candidatus Kaiseribacteriota TaxID=1752734 RepID=A0A1F6E5Q7_9BACT|nr:MAG: hypothetical protein A3C95_00665 [Candidatus Kaiserbacteria bacterium RIFCSPHIGHO2_02_FULL_56_30]OGG71703.1 MAG: hypothetical protein A3E65_01020 [Candidatus Kaiserbacteria bacterium RIFCSPHIGHO2_12_FULL_56_13]OGG81241.1 MAG: hypothetical protein A3H77_02345 [Candidatus Kaiserbacteria bacterium RIFCSPLOWO2_02_FULL_56_11]